MEPIPKKESIEFESTPLGLCRIPNSKIPFECLYEISMFRMQVFLSTILIFFSMLMIFIRNDTSIYLPLMTGIFGYWFPAPSRESHVNVNTNTYPEPPPKKLPDI